jgi:glycyl-tRNA synthetase beta subunit
MEFPEQRGINGAHYRRVAVKLVEVADALEASGRKRMKVISRGA